MGRRRGKETSLLDDLFDLLVVVPFWVGPSLALAAFVILRWLVPWSYSQPDPNNPTALTLHPKFSDFAVKVAPWTAGLILLIWLAAEGHKWTNRTRLDRQTGIESIRALSWRDFERLLGEAFRRQGYAIEQTVGAGADGGVDLRLRRGGEIVLVQCKQWQKWKVDVRVVRELYGVVASEGATAGIVVTSGAFTADATEFARKVPVTLIAGGELERMIADVQRAPAAQEPRPPQKAAMEFPLCPACGATMKMRTAEKGKNRGSKFWGCPRYPACRGTRPLENTRV